MKSQKSTDIDTLLKGVKVIYWTDCDGNRDKHYKVHSKINPKLWDRIEEIWGEDWVQMRDVVIGNDYELNGCYATVPEKTWLDMVEQLKERLFIVYMKVREWNGEVRPYCWKVWCEREQDAIDDAGPDRPEVVSFEIFEAEHNKTHRFMGAWEIYNELKQK